MPFRVSTCLQSSVWISSSLQSWNVIKGEIFFLSSLFPCSTSYAVLFAHQTNYVRRCHLMPNRAMKHNSFLSDCKVKAGDLSPLEYASGGAAVSTCMFGFNAIIISKVGGRRHSGRLPERAVTRGGRSHSGPFDVFYDNFTSGAVALNTSAGRDNSSSWAHRLKCNVQNCKYWMKNTLCFSISGR